MFLEVGDNGTEISGFEVSCLNKGLLELASLLLILEAHLIGHLLSVLIGDKLDLGLSELLSTSLALH